MDKTLKPSDPQESRSRPATDAAPAVASASAHRAPGAPPTPATPALRLRRHRVTHAAACLLVGMTFILVTVGGLVTSHDAGLAVPDYPTTFGHNMFIVPLELWVPVRNIFLEHFHRLLGSAVGLMTVFIALMLVFTQRDRRWLQYFGVFALVLVIAQGLMGGFRVTFNQTWPAMETPFRVLHGVTGQLFLCVTVLIAAATSRFWHEQRFERLHLPRVPGAVRWLATVLVGALVVQLVLGALVRHNEAAVAIPDFPTSYGQWIPPLTTQSIEATIDALPFEHFTTYYTPFQVGMHFAHRLWALAVVVVFLIFAGMLGARVQAQRKLGGPTLLIGLLLILQVAMGVSVVLSPEHVQWPIFKTMHQTIGALILALAFLTAVRLHIYRAQPILLQPQPKPSPQPQAATPRLDVCINGAGA